MTKTDPFAAPVAPSNTPAPRRRRDPDDDTTAPDPTPVAPPPAAPAAVPPSTGLAPAAPAAQGGTLASVLNTTTTGSGPTAADPTTAATAAKPQDSVSMLLGLARMRQAPVDPYNDYGPDGTRKLKWVQAAIDQVHRLTGRSRQEIETRALLGIEPLPDDVLEANWQALYGYPRSEYQPNR